MTIQKSFKIFFFFFFFFYRQAGSKLCDSFMIVFAQNNSILHWAVHQSNAFSQVSQGSSNPSLNNYGFICDAFFFICLHVHKSPSNKTYFFLLKFSCVHEDRESLCHPLLTWCSNRAWSTILHPNTAYINWGSLWGQICYSSKHLLINKTKNTKTVTRWRNSRSAKSKETR